MSFLTELQKKRTNYNYASQARTQAQSLSLLSSGIYTEEERFVYELLQNAIDAFVDVKEESLKIRIELRDNYLLFMHNGAAFTETDIEGLSDVGNGSKTTNAKKVGYKGIGFKSVFMKSTQVFVKSGSYCFKFDKEDSINYMPSEMPDGKLSPEDIPWQIIPIEAHVPLEVEDEKFNVITCIRLSDTGSFVPKVDELLKGLNFLLFLNAQDVSIIFCNNDTLVRKVARKEHNGEILLLIDDEVVSRWLIKSDVISVTKEVKAYIAQNPASVPQKLKDASEIEVSFAISVDDKGELRKVENSVAYTFLPTSYGNLAAPFLINSNFITDAGRQQLQQDSEWNKLIFKEAPALYFRWIAELSRTYKTYHRVLPSKVAKGNDELTKVFQKALQQAIEEIAFLPALQSDSLLKVSEAWIDRVGISEVIGVDAFVKHVGEYEQKNFANSGQIADAGVGILKSYGVFVFSEELLPNLFENQDVFSNLSIKQDVKLIDFLYGLCDRVNNSEILPILSNTPFILDENGIACKPSRMFFPSDYKSENELADEVVVMAQAIYDHYKKQRECIDWFNKMGVRELDESNYVEELFTHPEIVTEENAIDYGRFLFKCYQEGNNFEGICNYHIQNFPILTKKKELNAASNLFFGSKFKPFIDIENHTDEDIFVSEEYLGIGESISDWKDFFKALGVAEEILPSQKRLYVSNATEENRFDSEFFEDIVEASRKEYWESCNGYNYYFSPRCIIYDSYSFLERVNEYAFSKIVFAFIFGQDSPSSISACVSKLEGRSGFIDRVVSKARLIELGGEVNYFEWLVRNCKVIPTQLQTCEKATSVFSNTIPKIKEIAGTYAPVIDVEVAVSDEWVSYLNLKDKLELQDFLFILERISEDTKTDNRERVASIYTEIIARGWQSSPKIKEWGARHKILSSKEGEYLCPSALSYVTIDGFSSDSKVYVGKVWESNKEAMVDLLKNLGVQVIDKASPEYVGKSDGAELKSLLEAKVQYVALLKNAVAKSSSYEACVEEVSCRIKNSDFYHCEHIQLSYGDRKDTVERTTFAEDKAFYYTGYLKPSKIEPLLSPLCKYLGIRGYEKEFFVLLITHEHDDLVDYLEDKGFITDLLIAPSLETTTSATYIGSNDETLSKRIMYEAQLEAQRKLKECRTDWEFPERYGECDNNGEPYCYSTIEITDEIKEKRSIVLKSYKDRTAPFKINPEEWKAVVQNDAKLLVYTRVNGELDIVEIPQGDLIMNQTQISITFNSENLDKEEYSDRISIFAETLQYFKGLHFDFDKFHIAANATRVRDIYAKQSGSQFQTTDDDL